LVGNNGSKGEWMTQTETETKNPIDKITTTTTIVLDWKDRLKVLVGARINFQVTNEVEFVNKKFQPFKAVVTDDKVWTWFRKPNWMKPKGGECMVERKESVQ